MPDTPSLFTWVQDADPAKLQALSWTVYTDSLGEYHLVQEGLEHDFCELDNAFEGTRVRYSARVSERLLTYAEAVSFVEAHQDGPLPEPLLDDGSFDHLKEG